MNRKVILLVIAKYSYFPQSYADFAIDWNYEMVNAVSMRNSFHNLSPLSSSPCLRHSVLQYDYKTGPTKNDIHPWNTFSWAIGTSTMKKTSTFGATGARSLDHSNYPTTPQKIAEYYVNSIRTQNLLPV